ncbi:RING-H2 finger protein ATL60 [Sesamum alatum]|uniref:RING-type E3 ubiquitin transferase n=1 Tax=Sesamum alatum TaxID=300844 RepID=A0AAE1XKN5_9LAMI|nr:RING-H2 finger protein ATL60 [Sesamum alatum]
MGSSAGGNGLLGGTGAIELTGKIMVVAIIFLFFVIVFVFCLHLYARWFWHRRQENTTATTTTSRRRRLDFATAHQELTVVSAFHRGLDPCALKAIPVITFDPKEFKDGLECAVCLCEVSEGENARLLPKCNHGFHVDCIDMWFQSHSTCPLCRNPVSSQKQSNSATDHATMEDVHQAPMGENSGVNISSTEAPSFPTNVLFWGDDTQVSSFGPCMEEDHQGSGVGESSSSSSSSAAPTSNRPDGMLVIDIPRQINEEEEQKSPLPTRLRSLKRLLSGNRRVNPSSPRNLDLEQGGRTLS